MFTEQLVTEEAIQKWADLFGVQAATSAKVKTEVAEVQHKEIKLENKIVELESKILELELKQKELAMLLIQAVSQAITTKEFNEELLTLTKG